MNVTRVLVPTDFSAQSNFSIREALLLASAFGAAVRIVHAYMLPMPTREGDEDQEIAMRERDAARHLDAEHTEAQRRVQGKILVERELVIGPPALAIVECASSWRADLIVMGSHGRSALPRLLLGSVTEAVTRTASCPIWVVPTHLHRVVRTECESFAASDGRPAQLARARNG